MGKSTPEGSVPWCKREKIIALTTPRFISPKLQKERNRAQKAKEYSLEEGGGKGLPKKKPIVLDYEMIFSVKKTAY